MKSGRRYRKYWLKTGAAVVFVAALFIYSNIKADVREYESHTAILTDKELLPSLTYDISNAKDSIFVAIYMFKTADKKITDTEILKKALISAAKRGVKIYVVMDDAGKKDITTAANHDTGEELKKAGIKVVYDDQKIRLHAKITVIDGRITYIGSHNYTVSAMNYNREITARIVSDGAAKETIDFIKSVK